MVSRRPGFCQKFSVLLVRYFRPLEGVATRIFSRNFQPALEWRANFAPCADFPGPEVVKSGGGMAPIGAKSPQTDKARTRHGHGSDKPGAATDITDSPDTGGGRRSESSSWVADNPLRSNSARMTRRCSLEVRTRPLVSTVTGSFGVNPAGVTEEQSEPLVDVIALRTMISVRVQPEVLRVTLTRVRQSLF